MAGLAGCSAGGGLSLISNGGPAPVTATPTPTAIPGDTNGDGKLSEFEKQILAQNAPKDYTMGDGTVVSIDPKQPLPAAVVAEVRAAISPSTTILAMPSAYASATTAVHNAISAEGDATGKGIIVVTRATSYPNPGGPGIDGWVTLASNKDSTGIMFTPDKNSIVTDAQAWAASRGFELLVME
ncbi:hypothetical protein [Cryobacterium sp. GrIS_2_6]|uniref:hypothetical protein n=1 Tax=Cryobacterium sp. GrIS_2_6 TaxID=3162785 RepID=UPI002DFE05CA|nr:hypothetical protein [Cryobacterium psychrotolerans]